MPAANRSKLPPGPLLPWLPLLQYARDSHAYVEGCVKKYGDPFTVKTPYGPLVVTGRPELIREILRMSEEDTEGFGSESVRVFLGEGSVMLMGGLAHKEERKMLAPLFAAARTGAYAGRIAEIAQQELARHPREGFSMLQVTQEISLTVIIEVVFGVRTPERVEAFRRAIHAQSDAVSPGLFFVPWLRSAPAGRGPWAKYLRAVESLDRLIEEECEARRQTLSTSEATPDLLTGLLLAQQEGRLPNRAPRGIRDELVTMLLAGHETTGLALAWAFYWVHRDLHVLTRLLHELQQIGTSPGLDEVSRLPYLDAVCSEALRLYPVAPEVLRGLLAPQELFGYQLPKGAGVAISVSRLHNNEELYPEAARFRPERFLQRRMGPHEYAPFGGGSFRCVGAALAMQEMKLVLATILRGYSLRLLPSPAPRPARRNWVMGPSGTIPMAWSGR